MHSENRPTCILIGIPLTQNLLLLLSPGARVAAMNLIEAIKPEQTDGSEMKIKTRSINDSMVTPRAKKWGNSVNKRRGQRERERRHPLKYRQRNYVISVTDRLIKYLNLNTVQNITKRGDTVKLRVLITESENTIWGKISKNRKKQQDRNISKTRWRWRQTLQCMHVVQLQDLLEILKRMLHNLVNKSQYGRNYNHPSPRSNHNLTK